MSLSDTERTVIVGLELEKAHKTFAQAEAMCKAGFWDGAANRLYYAVFHAVNALFIRDKYTVNTHRGSHALFSQVYVKSGMLPADSGRLYNQLQSMREESDYNCSYNATPEEIETKVEPARQLIDAIDQLVNNPKSTI